MLRNTVCKCVCQLEKKELIATEPTNICQKRNGNLLYTILPIEQAKQHFYNRQLESTEQVFAGRKQRKLIEKLNLHTNKETG